MKIFCVLNGRVFVMLQVEGKMGDVYDRIVIIRSNSELGRPMMTIGHKDQKLDRIVYTD